MPAIYNLSDVFISYSRRDSDYARKLDAALRAAGHDVWVDWEDIPPTADWWSEIQAGIEAASTFVFIISPDSVTSDVCHREIDHALQCQKRLVPVLYRDVSDSALRGQMHPAISTHNWVTLSDGPDFDAQFPRLIDAIMTDLDYLRTHTRLLVRAREWELRDRDASFLLSGTAVQEAQLWLTRSAGMIPAPSPLQTEYILASQRAQTLRQRQILAGVSVALVISLALAVLSFALYRQAQAAEGVALARGTDVANQAATSDHNADAAATSAAIASTNEAEAFHQSTAVVNQAATSDANANIASTSESLALLRSTEVANQAAIASTNEAEALARGTQVADQAATSDANAAEAANQAQRAVSIALAAQGETAVEAGNYEFATLLGIEALANRAYTWDAERVLAEALQLQPETVSNVVFPGGAGDPLLSPDGSLRLEIDPEKPQQARLIDTATDHDVATLIGHTDDIAGAAWSPNGRFVATFSRDATARIWRASNGQSALTLLGHSAPLTAAAWSGNSTRLVTASSDGTLRIWNAILGGKPITLHYDDVITRLAYTADNTELFMRTEEHGVLRWPLWTLPEQLLARARAQVARSFTDEESILVGLPLVPSAPVPDPIESCEGAPESQLYPGVRGRVTSSDPIPLNVRVGPGTDSPRTGRVAPDQTFQVVEGPVCGPENRAWFRIVYGLIARGGWIAEGEMINDAPFYFAEPIPGR